MIRLIVFIVSLMITTNAFAVVAVVYEPNNPTVPGKVSKYGRIENTDHAPINSIVLDSPINSTSSSERTRLLNNRSTFEDLRSRGITYIYWKVIDGRLLEMTDQEKIKIDLPSINRANEYLRTLSETKTILKNLGFEDKHIKLLTEQR